MADKIQEANVYSLLNIFSLQSYPNPGDSVGRASFSSLLGLTSQQHIDLLFYPVFVIGLVRLCIRPVPAKK